MQNKIIKIAIIAFSLVMLGGCTDTASIKEARAAKEAAASALARANDAYNLAQNASNIASEAAYDAAQAQSTAESALACCNENSSKFDRMFEKAMMK